MASAAALNPASLTILYEDNHCLALAKPPGLLTQGVPPGIITLESLAKAYLKEKHHKPGNVYLGIPHRLDRPVSGVVLFARQTASARRLAEQFEKRQVTKVYWGAVEGIVDPAEGEWEDWVRKVKEESRTEIVTPEAPAARHSVLRYRVCQRCAGGDLVEFQPQTGRMHQIRVQTASRGSPVLGDVLYGAKLPFGPPAAMARDRVIALHARSLTFLHPIRYQPITVTAPLPEAWRALDLPDAYFAGEP